MSCHLFAATVWTHCVLEAGQDCQQLLIPYTAKTSLHTLAQQTPCRASRLYPRRLVGERPDDGAQTSIICQTGQRQPRWQVVDQLTIPSRPLSPCLVRTHIKVPTLRVRRAGPTQDIHSLGWFCDSPPPLTNHCGEAPGYDAGFMRRISIGWRSFR